MINCNENEKDNKKIDHIIIIWSIFYLFPFHCNYYCSYKIMRPRCRHEKYCTNYRIPQY